MLEAQIQGAAAVVVDIYSRYLFEKEVFERRAQAELSADDFCEIMERAQKASYGDGLDERYLQKFMWTWKPHYYSSGLSFYNFPYAFGLLFATGLVRHLPAARAGIRGATTRSCWRQRARRTRPAWRSALGSTFGLASSGTTAWRSSAGRSTCSASSRAA